MPNEGSANLTRTVHTILNKISRENGQRVITSIYPKNTTSDVLIQDVVNDKLPPGIETLSGVLNNLGSLAFEDNTKLNEITTRMDNLTTTVNNKVDKVEGKSLVDDDLIAKLVRIDENTGTVENAIDTIKVNGTVLQVVDKTVEIPLGAGLSESEEISIAEDGKLGIKEVKVSKLADDPSMGLVLTCGDAV